MPLSFLEAGCPVTRAAAPANQPLLINDRDSAWILESGTLDIFFVQMQNGEASGPRRHVMRIQPTQAVFGLPMDDAPVGTGLVAVGSPGSQLLKVSLPYLREPDENGEPRLGAIHLMENWITALSQAVAPDVPPKNYTLIEPGKQVKVAAGKNATCVRGVVWVRHSRASSQFLGHPGILPLRAGEFFPIVPHTWVTASDSTVLDCVDTAGYQKIDREWSGLEFFHHVVLSALAFRHLESDESDQEGLRKKQASDRRQARAALARLAAPLSRKPEHALIPVERDADPLLGACQILGATIGVDIQAPVGGKSVSSDPLRDIARASSVRVRRVLLRDRWWKDDHGPLLGYWQDGNRPVALVPVSGRGYELHDPADGGMRRVTKDIALTLMPVADTFYRPFPNKKLGAADLLAFGMKNCHREIRTALLAGIAGGLIGLTVPIFTGMLFDTIIPGAQRGQLLQIMALLLAGAIATAMFEATRSLALLRVEGRMGAALQAALWDRLLALPVSFFRHYNAGDLSDRANGIDNIRTALTGTVTNSIVSGIFSLFNLALMFYYSWRLTTVAIGLLVVACGATLLVGYSQVRSYRVLARLSGWLSGLVLQFISGIAKLRVSGTETRAFGAWSRGYSKVRTSTYGARTVNNRFSVFNAFFMVFGPLTIFYAVYQWTGRLSAGDFLAFNASFGQLFGATMALAGAVIQVMMMVPIFERATPILTTAPEVDTGKGDPGELTGEIEVRHVSFRYQESGPAVLKDVSFGVESGQFVALVGPSGCGKSTLFRLLLGFESPEAGAVSFDGQDLKGLDLNIVRRQMGVVLQNSTLFRGDMLSNIIGSKPLTLDDAWEAARLAGLEEDIREMPMGMYTIVSEGGGGLSGGQRQRLMIARAIVSKPRILLFDEATSALDNQTQAIVSKSLEGLKATRIVIAHRLSTVVHADKILVFDQGSLVQSGTYSELIEQPGLFAELVKRQLA